MHARFDKLLKQFGMEQYREALEPLLKPCIYMITDGIRTYNSCSKLGGSPDVPVDFDWPVHKLGNYRFFCQINLVDVPAGVHALPKNGLLSFFYAYDETGNVFWQDPNYVKAFLFDISQPLSPMVPPNDVRMGASLKIRFESGLSLPSVQNDGDCGIKEDDQETYFEMRGEFHQTDRYLFGYPSYSTLGYDPTPGPDWIPLLTMYSDEQLEWNWHDGDWIMTFIQEDKLRLGDFSEIKADAG